MKNKFSVLILCENENRIKNIVSVLREYNIRYYIVSTFLLAEKKLMEERFDVAILEKYNRSFIEKLSTNYKITVAIIADEIDENVLNLIPSGISEVLSTPIKPSRVRLFIEKIKSTVELKKKIRLLTSFDEVERSFKGHISNDPEMREIYNYILKVAKTSSTVLITGETGTGKEVLSRLVHDLSNAKKENYVAINCSSIPENLLESELFGYERGSFTGAVGTKKGLFEIANNGTLLLDEIGDMPLLLQAKLLRVLEDGLIRRIGGTKNIKTNFRLIAATNQDLEKLVQFKEFRKDLFYRLNVFHIHIPPLRDRKTEIISLSFYFIEQFNKEFKRNIKGLTEKATLKLLSYNFPGNVRELKHIIEKAFILTNGDMISDESILLPRKNLSFNKDNTKDENKYLNVNIEQPMKDVLNYWTNEIRKEYIKNLLKKYGYNVKLITDIAKIERSYFYKLLKKYDLVDSNAIMWNNFPHNKK